MLPEGDSVCWGHLTALLASACLDCACDAVLPVEEGVRGRLHAECAGL